MKPLEKNVQYVEIQNISYDVNNPRGETGEQIENDQEFKKLVTSVTQYEILEPLIVKKDETNPEHFKLIDGERRLRAAIKTAEGNLEYKVPTLIAKDDMDGRILAYQVHMLRKNWSKAAETESIKTIITDSKQDNPKITEKELIKKLKEITAHTNAEISDLLKLIEYDDDIIKKVISGQIDMSYLIQIESNFIRPLKGKYPLLLQKYGEENVRKLLVNKAVHGLLVNTRFLMDKFKYVFKDEKQKNKIEELIEIFLTNKNKNIQEIFDEYLTLNPPLDKKIKAIKKLPKTKIKRTRYPEERPGVDSYKKIKLTKKEESSLESIRKNFENIGKKLSHEESDYISEAIYCSERSCYKAALVMIWAAGISKVIKYISNNITEFNSVSKSMSKLNKDPYRQLKNYRTDVLTEDDLRDGKDRQLLLYLLYKKIITRTEDNKLRNCYITRCDCAHPTDIKLNIHEVTSIFENIYKLFFNNPKLI